jgi:hypothetical protein
VSAVSSLLSEEEPRPGSSLSEKDPRDAQRVCSQKSNGRESVLAGSHMCPRHRERFLTPKRGKAELIGWGPRSAVCLPDAFSHRWGSADGGQGPFMALPPYTRIREGEVHELGLSVRNCSHRVRSRPLSETSKNIERPCEVTSAEDTTRCTSRGKDDDQDVPRIQEESWEGTRNRPEPTGFQSSVTNFFPLACPCWHTVSEALLPSH